MVYWTDIAIACVVAAILIGLGMLVITPVMQSQMPSEEKCTWLNNASGLSEYDVKVLGMFVQNGWCIRNETGWHYNESAVINVINKVKA